MTREKALGVLRVYVGGCREDLGVEKGRCGAPAEFVLWGKLIPPEGLGPRCYDHAVRHVGPRALSWGSGYALLNLDEMAVALATALADPERVERAARELWKLDVDCGTAEGYDRDRYVRRAITVLRHAGAPFTSPEGFDGCAKAPGGCARGYCRSRPACPGNVCRAVC